MTSYMNNGYQFFLMGDLLFEFLLPAILIRLSYSLTWLPNKFSMIHVAFTFLNM
jgi:hypothetical protein